MPIAARWGLTGRAAQSTSPTPMARARCRRNVVRIRLALAVNLVAVCLASMTDPARAATGALSIFAGGTGWGPGTNVGQSPVGVGMVGDRVLAVDGYTSGEELPSINGHYATVVRAIDVRTGLESVVGGHLEGGFSPDGSRAVGSPLSGAKTAVGDAFGNVYLADNHRIRKITAAGLLVTVAGTGTLGFAGDGGPATMAELSYPYGIAIALDGGLVFSDSGNARIRRIAPNGVITTIAGTGIRGSAGDGGPAPQAQLTSPHSLGFDSEGNLYIADTPANRIRMVTPAGTITTFAETPYPLGLAITGVGRVLVTHGHGIRSIEASGRSTFIAGTENEPGYTGDGGPAVNARLNAPRGVTVDRAGNVYVADSSNKRVRKIDTAGTITTIAGNGSVRVGGDGGPAVAAQMADVERIRTTPTGVYLFDGAEQIRHVDAAGIITTIGTARPFATAVDRAGNLYMSEGNRVVKRTPNGTVSVVAGNGEPSTPGGDGGSATATGITPRLLAVDGGGNLYIGEGDSYPARIRRVDIRGVITTVAGAEPHDGNYTPYPRAALHEPVGDAKAMAVGPDGALYVLFPNRILRISCGLVTRVAEDVALYVGQGARDFAIDRVGNLLVSVESWVYRITPDGRGSIVAGGGTSPVAEGLPATSARLEPIRSVALDDSGNLYLDQRSRALKVAGVAQGAADPGPACDTTLPGDPSGTSYHPLAPARILDTRFGTGGYLAPVAANATLAVDVTGVGGVPETGVSAVALNVTVTHPSDYGFLTVFPSGTSRPLTSSLNFVAGQTVANLVVAKVGVDGKVSIYSYGGGADVIADVVGWFGAGGSRYNGLTPARLLDTRNGTGGFFAPVSPNGTIAVGVTGTGGVPAAGVSAVALNITVTEPSVGGFLSVFPSGTSRPLASSLNFVAGQTVANLAMAKVGVDGKISIYNYAGWSHVVADVVGWFGAEVSPYHGLTPARILDTRNGTGGFAAPVGAKGTVAVSVTGKGGVPATGVSAVALNLTVTEPSAGGFLTVFPSGTPRPLTSSLNFVAGQTVANLVMATVGADGKISIYNNAGSSHLVADVVGWFGPAR
jgi:sugar lactone lactonase YvrE